MARGVSLTSRIRPWLEESAALAAALVPFGFAVAFGASVPQWRDDAVVVRGLSLTAAPGAGALSSALTTVMRLLPLGNVTFRASLVAALGAAAGGWLLFRLIRRLLDEARPSPVNPLLGLLASLTATCSPMFLREATVGGGATLAVATSLAALQVWHRGTGGTWKPWLWLGALVGMALVENPVAAVLLVLALVAQGLLLRPQAGERGLGLGLVGLVGVAALVALPAVLRPLAPSSWVGLGLAHGFGELKSLDVASLRARGLGAWAADVGFSAFALTWLGVAVGVARKPSRWVIAPLLVPLILDVLAPTMSSGVLSPDLLAPLRALSLCAAAAAAALGVQTVVLWLRGSSLAMARPAAALVVAYHATLAALAAEESLSQADRTQNAGSEAWTDQALERLPPQALVLVRSEAITWRLWAARLGSGLRPDVTVVPLPMLGRGKLAGALLAEEPALVPLLRDVSATGAPSEFGLSSVADARPLFLELDPRWDRRFATHVVPENLWLRFAAQPYGASDRRLNQGRDATALYQVIAAARRAEPHDEATLEILASHARETAISSALVHDKDTSQQSLLALASLRREPGPDDEIWSWLEPQRKPDPRAKRAKIR